MPGFLDFLQERRNKLLLTTALLQGFIVLVAAQYVIAHLAPRLDAELLRKSAALAMAVHAGLVALLANGIEAGLGRLARFVETGATQGVRPGLWALALWLQAWALFVLAGPSLVCLEWLARRGGRAVVGMSGSKPGECEGEIIPEPVCRIGPVPCYALLDARGSARVTPVSSILYFT